jgi:hypothetical protein
MKSAPASRVTTESLPSTAASPAAQTHAPVVQAADTLSFRAAWRCWLPVALTALALALLFVDPFAGDWDALDYTILAVRGAPSSMLFGRTLFIYTNHFAYRLAHALFGLQPEHAYLLFKYMVVGESPLAVMAMWAFARRLTGARTDSDSAATVAALLLALSPFFVIYAGQAMTEIPSLLLLMTGLALHLRGIEERRAWLILLGACILGACVNVREAVAIYGLWLVLAPLVYRWPWNARALILTGASVVLFLICALGPFAALYLFDLGGYRASWYGWVGSMRMEESVHPITLFNLLMLAFFFFVASPLVFCALPFALRQEWRARRCSPLLALALTGLVANLLLITNYSTVINGRYQLTGLPGAIPLVAVYLLHRQQTHHADATRALRRVVTHVALVAVIVGAVFLYFAWPTLRGQTVAVSYYRSLGLGRWDTIGTGSGWPGARVGEVIDEYLRAGRRVFLDTDVRLWFTDRWRGQETQQVVALQNRFHFRHVAGTIYELRPLADETAHDDPQLARLLDKPPSRLPFLNRR